MFFSFFLIYFLIYNSSQKCKIRPFWAAKLRIFSEITKKTTKFSLNIYVFFDFSFDFSAFCRNFAPDFKNNIITFKINKK